MFTDEAFTAGEHTTNYLDEELDPERIEEAQEKWGPTETTTETDDEEVTERDFVVEVNGKRFEVNLEERGAPSTQAGGDSSGGGSTQQFDDAGPNGGGDDDSSSTATAEGEQVTAEMQGTILDVNVTEDDDVSSGDVLCVLEAMKMENDVVASRGGTVAEIVATEGESVDMGDVLCVLE